MENKKLELNDEVLDVVSGGRRPNPNKPRWYGWHDQPCTNCDGKIVERVNLEENGNEIKALRCAECGYLEYV